MYEPGNSWAPGGLGVGLERRPRKLFGARGPCLPSFQIRLAPEQTGLGEPPGYREKQIRHERDDVIVAGPS